MSTDKPNTAGAEGNDTEEFVAVEVDEHGKPVGGEASVEAAEEEDEDDDAGESDAAADEDETLGHDENEEREVEGETSEQRRERRRLERKAKSIRNRAAARAKDQMLAQQGRAILDLQEQVTRLQGRTVQYDLNTLQGNLQRIESQQAEAKSLMAQLVKAQDGDGVAEITELQMRLHEQHRQVSDQLRRAKSNQQQGAPETLSDEAPANGRSNGQANRAPKFPPEVARRAQAWASKNKAWFQNATPEEKIIVADLDRQVLDAGFNPLADAYWTELDRRVKQNLPHHFKKANGGNNGGGNGRVNGESNASRGGPRMAPASQNGGGRPVGRNEVRVTPDRKKAMQDAGMWDDPVKRNRMLKQYAEYDRQNAGN